MNEPRCPVCGHVTDDQSVCSARITIATHYGEAESRSCRCRHRSHDPYPDARIVPPSGEPDSFGARYRIEGLPPGYTSLLVVNSYGVPQHIGLLHHLYVDRVQPGWRVAPLRGHRWLEIPTIPPPPKPTDPTVTAADDAWIAALNAL